MAVEIVDLFHSPRMPALAIRCGDELLHDLPGKTLPNQPRSQREYIGMVVFARIARRRQVVAQRRSHAGNLVGCHRRTNTCSVDHHADVSVSSGNRRCDSDGEVRIVDGIVGVRALIDSNLFQN